MTECKINNLSIKCDLYSSDVNEDIQKFETRVTEVLKSVFGDNVINIKTEYENIEN